MSFAFVCCQLSLRWPVEKILGMKLEHHMPFFGEHLSCKGKRRRKRTVDSVKLLGRTMSHMSPFFIKLSGTTA